MSLEDILMKQGLTGAATFHATGEDMAAVQKDNRAMQELAAMKAAVQGAGGDPAAAYKALLGVGTPNAITAATHFKGLIPKPAEPYTLGPDQARFDASGKPIAVGPAKTDTTLDPVIDLTNRLQSLPPDHPARPALEARVKYLTTHPSLDRQPGTAITPVKIVDPNNPGQAIVIDGRTGRPLGNVPETTKLGITGGRESVYVQRMMMGANQASKDLANVVQLPLTASTGVFGGRKQGPGLFDAGAEVLANKATGQEAQAYNAMATGFQRSLAQIESAGLMPSGSLTHQMDAVLFKEGDTNLTKLHKLAQTRQIVEAGMETVQANPRVSPEEKAKVVGILDSIRKSVPFTHSDLIALQEAQRTDPKATLGSILKAKVTGDWSIRPK